MSYYTATRVNWLSFLDAFGAKLLLKMGYDQQYNPPSDSRNVITEMLRNDPERFVEYVIATSNIKNVSQLSPEEQKKKVNRAGVCRAVILLQMRIYDRNRGPEQDGRPKALRRHWYAYFKQFAQMFAFAIGDVKANGQGSDEMTDRAWTARLSESYADLVDSGEVTYRQLWVEDASRMLAGDGRPLFEGLNLVLAVEKDSLFNDFRGAAKALGAKGLISGKGKNSKAAMEKFLRDTFGWSENNDPFDRHNPLIVLHISDYDYDGHAVIGPTFGQQARRYTSHILEARVGVKPEQVIETVDQPFQAAYQIKLKDQAYQDWANDYALYSAVCNQCGHEYFTIGNVASDCPECGGEGALEPVPDLMGEPRGYEVESLRSRDYYKALVDTLVDLVPLEDIISHLRKETMPSYWNVGDSILDQLLSDHKNFQRLQRASQILTDMTSSFRDAISSKIQDYAQTYIDEHTEEIQELGDDPELEDFENYVIQHGADQYASPWNPIDLDQRERHVSRALEGDIDLADELVEVEITDLKENTANVIELLDAITYNHDNGEEDEL